MKKTIAPSLPGLGSTLAAGFEFTSKHLWLILLPMALDAFLWLGPRLGIGDLWQESAAALGGTPFGPMVEQMTLIAPQINLFAYLSLPLIGVPVLMGGLAPEATPLPTAVLELGEPAWAPVVMLGLNLAGLALAALYYGAIAQTLRSALAVGEDEENGGASFIAQFGPMLVRLLGLALVFLFLLALIWLPAFPLALFAAFFSSGLAVAILLGVFVMLALYLSFALHGIVLFRRPVLRAVAESARLVQRHRWATMLLFAIVFGLRALIASLWRIADNGSWITLVSIFGHSFISTAFVVATFLFYRDRFALMMAERQL
jgi:hypothetical protein